VPLCAALAVWQLTHPIGSNRPTIATKGEGMKFLGFKGGTIKDGMMARRTSG